MQTYLNKTQKTSNKHWIIDVQNLSVSYEDFEALSNISFQVETGSFVYIVGPNGSGKTTLMNVLTGLTHPSHGKYSIYTDTFGYLPQNISHYKTFPITVEEVIYSGYKKQTFIIPQAIREEIRHWLKVMEIEDLLHRPMGRLSGGQQQRVLLIRALVNKPELLILDEPTSALDPTFRDLFNSIIDHLHQSGVTIIYVTHNLTENEDPEKLILEINQKILYYGSIREYQLLDKGMYNHV